MRLGDLFEQGGVGVVAKNAKQAKDPRYSMSMTVDVKPGETEKQAAKFGNKLDKDGNPPLLRESALEESRGITARVAGDQYVNVADSKDILTIQSVEPIHPEGKQEFDSTKDLLDALNNMIPAQAIVVNDNKPSTRSKAAILAHVKDSQNRDQYWVRYIEKIPGHTIHGLWPTLRGYKYKTDKSEAESIAIKPSDLITDSNPRSMAELATTVKRGIHSLVDGTPDEELARIMDEAVDKAMQGSTDAIENSVKYNTVISKYGSEYLGPIALLSGKFTGGDIPKAMKALDINSFVGGKAQFSSSKSQELWDSIIITPDGKQVQISTKMHKGGGAASSVTGVLKQVTPEIEEQHPQGVRVMRLLGEEKSDEGMIQAAMLYGVIDDKAAQALREIPRSSRNIDDIQDDKLKTLVRMQGVAKDTLARMDYRVFYHALTAITNKTIALINNDPEFRNAMMKALNNNNYLQLVTKTSVSGNNMSLDYYGKYPTEFSGVPTLRNKTYFATGQKGRIGFKLKMAGEPDEEQAIEPVAQEPEKVKRVVRPGWHKDWTGKDAKPKSTKDRAKRK